MYKVFSIFDTKVSTFGQPFFSQSDGAAVRMVVDAASDAGTMLFKHPTDFVLYRLGTFDEDSGFLESLKPTNLGVVSALVAASAAVSVKGVSTDVS
jgi:hypothetical protein